MYCEQVDRDTYDDGENHANRSSGFATEHTASYVFHEAKSTARAADQCRPAKEGRKSNEIVDLGYV